MNGFKTEDFEVLFLKKMWNGNEIFEQIISTDFARGIERKIGCTKSLLKTRK